MLVKLVAANLIVALMLGAGLATRTQSFRDIQRRPALYVKALAAMWLGVPLATLAIVSVLPIGPLAAELLLVMAVCPGAPSIPIATKRAGERFSTVGVNVLVLTSVLAPVLVPAWIAVLDHIHAFGLHMSAAEVSRETMFRLIVPLLAGVAIRAFAPRLADRLTRPVQIVFVVALIVALAVLLYAGASVVFRAPLAAYGAMLLIILAASLLGYVAGAPDERRTIGLATALGNPGLGLAVIAAGHPERELVAFVALFVLFRFVATIPLRLWVKDVPESV
jgi:BASS family bile acid:Na+ symporter